MFSMRMTTYRQLSAAHIVETVEALSRRIGERFPDSGLSRVAAELHAIGGATQARISALRRPRWALRASAGLVALVIVAVITLALAGVSRPSRIADVKDLLQTLESAVQDVVFIGIAVFFLVSLETRLKRRQALEAIHELRSIVHVVDMHQLTKDPEVVLSVATASARRAMTRPELARYLDYCSELLSLTSKLAALYAQHLTDSVVLDAVHEVEALATGMSGRIWQKIVILDTASAGS